MLASGHFTHPRGAPSPLTTPLGGIIPIHHAPNLRPASSLTGDDDPTAQLISALIATGTYNPEAYGFVDSDFIAYSKVHAFAAEYQLQTGHAPSVDLLAKRHREFPYDSHTNIAWAVHRMGQELESRRARVMLSQAMLAQSENGVEAMLDVIHSQLPRIKQISLTPLDAADLSMYDQEQIPSIPVAGAKLQDITGGIRPGNLWTVVARTNVGKSIELLRHALAASEAGWNVALFSLEMTGEEVITRLHTMIAGPTETVDERKRLVADWFDWPARGRINIHEQANGTCNPKLIEQACAEHTLVIIDHIGLIRTNTGARMVDEHNIAAAAVIEVKEIALRTKTPFIVAAQANRTFDDKQSRKIPPPPSTVDISGTDHVGNSSDVVYFLLGHPASRVRRGYMVKNRHGTAECRWNLDFRPAIGSFTEISGERYRYLKGLDVIDEE